MKWTKFESTFFMKLRDAFASEPDARLDPCALARAVGGLTCASVYARLVRDARRGAHFEAARAERAARLDSSSRGADPEDPDFSGDEVLPKAATAGGWPRGKKRRRTVYGAKQSSAKKSARRAIPTTQVQTVRVRRGPGRSVEKNVRAGLHVCERGELLREVVRVRRFVREQLRGVLVQAGRV